MKLKKMLSSLIAILLLATIVVLPNAVYATTLNPGEENYMGIIELMECEEPYMGYSIGNPRNNAQMAAQLWNIVRYKSSTVSSGYENGDIYCVKSGVGFTRTENNQKIAPYNVYYNMKTEKDKIKAENNSVLNTLVDGTITLEDGSTISQYNAILAVLDMLYLTKEPDQKEKEQIINNILNCAMYDSEYSQYNAAVELMEAYPLTVNDIKAVQQAAIWYFTNYYKKDETATDTYRELPEHEMKFDKTGNTSWLNYTTNKTDYSALSDYTPNGLRPQYDAGQARSYQAEILYKYIIKQAKAKANEYENVSQTAGAPVSVTTTTLGSEINGENSIIGPIHINQNNNNAYTLDFEVKNHGDKITNYKLLDENKQPTANGTTVKSLVGKDFYLSVPKNQVDNLTIDININYSEKQINLWASTTNKLEQPLVEITDKKESVPVTLTLKTEKPFDLALRKYITQVNGVELTGDKSRVPNIDKSTLQTGTTATYKHKKDPVIVNTNSEVIYKMTIYNEGQKAGRATKVVDQLPTGLQFVEVISGNFKLDSYTEENNTLNLIRKEDNSQNLAGYTNNNLAEETIEIKCKVTAEAESETSKILTNVAWIAEEIDEDGTVITDQVGKDRDSEPANKPTVDKDNMENYTGNTSNKTEDLSDRNYHYKGKQDDDDFEKLILLPEAFDLKLIKFITEVNGEDVPDRIENIDVSKLNTLDATGNMTTTADYQLNKTPVPVKKGDIVTYTFRIYNEGTLDGYAQKISEDIPEGLEFIWSEKEGEALKDDDSFTEEEKEAIEFNQKYLWGDFVYDEETKEKIVEISSDYLSKEKEITAGDNLITAFGRNDGQKTEEDLKYKELAVKLKVVSDDTTGAAIRNEAAITDDANKNGDPVKDRDSVPEDWKEHPDHEDDEDHDYVALQSFDLALRKFIIAVSDDTKIEPEEELKNKQGAYTRAPIVDTSKLNTVGQDGKLITTATYNHTKEPVIVKPNDIVVYMLRVYNEGDMDGYAAQIKDHLPPYLEFVDDEFNAEYGWEVSEDGRTVTTDYLSSEDNLISKAEVNEDGKIELHYKEVPIMCKVSENPKTSQNITNIADITKYLDQNKKPVADRDSEEDNVKLPEDKDLPNYKDNETGDYVPGQQDDDDFEKVVVKIFDLALRKWVTQAIVIENGQENVTQTGHDPWDDPEAVVKVELHRKKLDQVVVKFKYSIRVYNQGEVEGYAKEVTDYIPEGLKFVAEDNPGWTDEGNNVISTRLLENTLLKPGEYADVEVLLTWINSEDNMGVMTNMAEISEDYNEYDIPDIDSTPDNKKPGEDDIDDAPVMLSISTGQARIYFTLGFIVLITTAGGVILIKKYVL